MLMPRQKVIHNPIPTSLFLSGRGERLAMLLVYIVPAIYIIHITSNHAVMQWNFQAFCCKRALSY